jgi:hypothetical protein
VVGADRSKKPDRKVCRAVADANMRMTGERHEVLRRLASAGGNSRCAFISSRPPAPLGRTVGRPLVHRGRAFPACGRSRIDRDPFPAIHCDIRAVDSCPPYLEQHLRRSANLDRLGRVNLEGLPPRRLAAGRRQSHSSAERPGHKQRGCAGVVLDHSR